MANICFNQFEFNCSSKEEFLDLIEFLVHDEYKDKIDRGNLELCEELIEDYNCIKDDIYDFHYVDIQENDYSLVIAYSTKWTPNLFFEDTDFIKNSEIEINGYAEECGCEIYETYYRSNSKGSVLEVESYGSDIESKIEFYNVINAPENEILENTFYFANEVSNSEIYYPLTEIGVYDEVKEGFRTGKFNILSLLALTNEVGLIYDLTNEKDFDKMLDKADKELIEVYFEDFYNSIEVLATYKDKFQNLNQRIVDIIDDRILETRQPIMQKYLELFDDIKGKVKDLYNRSGQDYRLIINTPEEYLDKRMLLEQKLYGNETI